MKGANVLITTFYNKDYSNELTKRANQTAPMKNRNLKVDDNWRTPDLIYTQLHERFNFNFDPCPYFEGEITPDKDRLLIDWGKVNFVNPPYSRKLKEAFVMKAIDLQKKGITSVFLLPVSTSTKLFHDHIKPNAKSIEFVRGRIKFMKYDEHGNLYTPKNGGMHDSMIVVF